MNLLYDVARCMGENQLGKCPKRDTCERYLQREKTGQRTPVYERMCTGLSGEYYSHIDKQEPRP